MRRYETILFDLDGTIVDSKSGILKCIRRALDLYDIAYKEEDLNKMVGPPFRVSMRQFLGIDDGDLVEKLIYEYRYEYERSGWRECSVYDGVEDLLKRLISEGFTLAVATSKPIKFSKIMLDDLDLSKYFKFIGGASSDEARDTKSDVINHVLNALEVKDKSSVVMVGDRLYDIEGAKQSGVDSIGVLWGYGDTEEFENYGATYILDTPKSLGDFLTNGR